MTECWSDDRLEKAAREGVDDPSHLRECERCRERLEEAQNELAMLVELHATQLRGRGARDEGALVFSSTRGERFDPEAGRLDYGQLSKRLNSPGNGLGDIYRVDHSVLNTK